METGSRKGAWEGRGGEEGVGGGEGRGGGGGKTSCSQVYSGPFSPQDRLIHRPLIHCCCERDLDFLHNSDRLEITPCAIDRQFKSNYWPYFLLNDFA